MQNLLVIGFVWPEPNSSAAGTRMVQLLKLFVAQGWEVTFASAAGDSEFMFDLTTLGIRKVAIQLNDSSFDTFVKNMCPTLVLFDRFMTEEQFGWRVAKQCPGALRILDTEDLHCLRHARQLAAKENRGFLKADLFSDIAKREIASIFRCDLSLIISEFEMDLLRDVFKVDPSLLFYLPFMSDPVDESGWLDFGERRDFVFIGNFLHEPNWDAVQFLKTEVWPRVHQLLPAATLRIYGAYPLQKVLQLHKPSERFLVMGRAESASEVVGSARVMLAPVRFGAGAKGKLLEAMQCGTPSVTTSIGAESMAGSLPWSGIVEDDAEAIAAAAVKLYTDEDLWYQSRKNGKDLVHARYLGTAFASEFILRLCELQRSLDDHRQQNFIGAMLQHHAMASTKFMSRWIEAKNAR